MKTFLESGSIYGGWVLTHAFSPANPSYWMARRIDGPTEYMNACSPQQLADMIDERNADNELVDDEPLPSTANDMDESDHRWEPEDRYLDSQWEDRAEMGDY